MSRSQRPTKHDRAAVRRAFKPTCHATTGHLHRILDGQELRSNQQIPEEDTMTPPSIRTAVDRRQFGISWNSPLPKGGLALATDVRLHVDLQLIKS
jgi:hypothetical protein